MTLHDSITWERVEEAVQESLFGMGNPGFCLACGEDADGVEPDAEEYECGVCGEQKVYGAETVLLLYF